MITELDPQNVPSPVAVDPWTVEGAIEEASSLWWCSVCDVWAHDDHSDPLMTLPSCMCA